MNDMTLTLPAAGVRFGAPRTRTRSRGDGIVAGQKYPRDRVAVAGVAY